MIGSNEQNPNLDMLQNSAGKQAKQQTRELFTHFERICRGGSAEGPLHATRRPLSTRYRRRACRAAMLYQSGDEKVAPDKSHLRRPLCCSALSQIKKQRVVLAGVPSPTVGWAGAQERC